MEIHPYLFFSNGTCRDAFGRYQEVLGGELTLVTGAEMPAEDGVTPEMADLIMHASLAVGEGYLFGSDDPTGDGGPVKGACVSYSAADPDDARRVFDALSEGGEVTMEFAATSWSPAFGMCTDRFGMPWMVSADPA